jgi:hypothetical protein
MNDPNSPLEVISRFDAEKPRLQIFYDMAVNYFRCKCLDKHNLERRPPVALCLRDPDYVFTLKPGFTKPMKFGGRIIKYGEMLYDSVYIDCVSITEIPSKDRPILKHEKVCSLRLAANGQLSSKGGWSFRDAPIAVHEFVNVAKDFVLFPWQVFGRSTDYCCCCRKYLTDDTSRSRGIGPECLRSAALCFGVPPK